MHIQSASTFVRGSTFPQPQLQSVLPVVVPRSYSDVIDLTADDAVEQGNVEFVGFVYVPSKAYAGDELTEKLGNYDAPIAAVYKLDEGLNPRPVSHYMALIVDREMAMRGNYNTLPGYRSLGQTGYSARWTAPSYAEQLYTRGTLISVIEHNLNPATPPAPVDPTIPVIPGATKWDTTVTSVDLQCAYYDFNWIDLFIKGLSTSDIAFMDYRLDIISNPPGGEFKATVVKTFGSGVQPAGGRFYDTIRVIRLARDLPQGDTAYPFQFEVVAVDKDGKEYRQTVNYTLNITAQS